MRLTVTLRELHPRREFRIARGRRTAIRNVFLRLEHDGITGFGEASPNAYYHETAEDIAAHLEGLAGFLAEANPATVEDLADLWQAAWPLLSPSRAAQCALDLALWDWLGRRLGQTVAELAWGHAPRPIQTFCTIGLSTPEELPAKLAELAGFPCIKVKSDASADLDAVRRVATELHPAVLAVDANCAWTAERLPDLAAELSRLGVAFLEQPLPPSEDARFQPGAFPLPIMADESCVTEDHVEAAARHFDGFNVKLVKCGGLTPALRMVRRGRALGRRVMVGCMLESSLLIAAGAVAAQGATYADLDGAWLLADDPFTGLPLEQGELQPGPDPGFGVTPGALFPAPR